MTATVERKTKHLEGAAARRLSCWPVDALPTPAEAERAARDALVGAATTLDPAVVARFAADATPLERGAFAADDEVSRVVRAAAGLRWRLAVAIVTAPDRGPHDAEAVSALLTETDALLAALQDRAEQAPERLGGAGALRKAIVRDAVLLGSVVSRLAIAGPVAAPQPAAAPQTRMLSIVAGEDTAAAHARPRPRAAIGLLVAAALAAGGYHVHRYLTRPVARPAVDGAPVGAVASADRNGRQLLVTGDGKPLPEPQLSELRAAQKRRGNEVLELRPGLYSIERAR